MELAGGNKPMEADLTLYCLAKNRQGKPCMRYKAKGKNRCRMHGGVEGIGGQLGNKNAFKHGYYCKESIAQRSEIHKMLKEYRQLCGEIDSI